LSVGELLDRWPEVSPQLDRLAEKSVTSPADLKQLTVGPNDVAPPFKPGRFFCAAANYIEHANEMDNALAAKSESKPYMFIKPDTALIGHNGTVIMPVASSQVDWEIELAVIIGREARHVSADEALSYVAGYSVVNNISARDLNVRDDFPFKMDWF
jgi:2,4-diketo-3-deoxy-L-fuconate hydrolase